MALYINKSFNSKVFIYSQKPLIIRNFPVYQNVSEVESTPKKSPLPKFITIIQIKPQGSHSHLAQSQTVVTFSHVYIHILTSLKRIQVQKQQNLLKTLPLYFITPRAPGSLSLSFLRRIARASTSFWCTNFFRKFIISFQSLLAKDMPCRQTPGH